MKATDPFWAVVAYLVTVTVVAFLFRLMGMKYYVAGATALALVTGVVVYGLIT